MTRNDLYQFVSDLLDGYNMSASLFDSFLDIAQATVEGQQPWRFLLNEDATQTWNPGDTFQTVKKIPSSFLNFESETPMVAADVNNNIIPLKEIPFAERFRYKDLVGKFCVDYITGNLYICGNPVQSYTLHQYFIKESPLVSYSTSGNYPNAWIFPERFHKILALYVAIYFKLGPDYDIISNSQGNQFAAMAGTLLDLMTKWDARMQVSQTRGFDPFDGGPSTPDGQRVNANSI